MSKGKITNGTGGMGNSSNNIVPQGRRNSNSKQNVLSNKALAYLNNKKATSILKNYEESMNSTKFINSAIGKNLMKRLENS